MLDFTIKLGNPPVLAGGDQ